MVHVASSTRIIDLCLISRRLCLSTLLLGVLQGALLECAHETFPEGGPTCALSSLLVASKWKLSAVHVGVLELLAKQCRTERTMLATLFALGLLLRPLETLNLRCCVPISPPLSPPHPRTPPELRGYGVSCFFFDLDT